MKQYRFPILFGTILVKLFTPSASGIRLGGES